MNGVFLLSLLFYGVVASIIVQYKPGINYGQIFYDYSGNGRHAVNGYSYLTTDYDTTPTDRGAYFNSSGLNVISFPSNDRIPTQFSLPNTFTAYMWVFREENGSDQYLFVRNSDTGKIVMMKSNNNLQIVVYQGGNYCNCISTDSSFVSSKI
jgi:hypothetical protein